MPFGQHGAPIASSSRGGRQGSWYDPIGHSTIPLFSTDHIHAFALQAHIDSAAVAAEHVQRLALAAAQDVHDPCKDWTSVQAEPAWIMSPPSSGTLTSLDIGAFHPRPVLDQVRRIPFGQPELALHCAAVIDGKKASQGDTGDDGAAGHWRLSSPGKGKARADSCGHPNDFSWRPTQRRHSLPRCVQDGPSSWLAEYEAAYAAQLTAIANGFYQQEHDRFWREWTAATRGAPNAGISHPVISASALRAQATHVAKTRATAVLAHAQARARAESTHTTHAIQTLAAGAQRQPSHQRLESQTQVDRHGRTLATATPDLVHHARSESHRDRLLAQAHERYTRDPHDDDLLPLLHALHKLHPRHLPTLLLLGCVYFTRGQSTSSLYYSHQILSIEPDYVEAMSNIGTTLRAMGRISEAETWWYKALEIRPGYWDALENLLGVLCTGNTHDAESSNADQAHANERRPRYEEALRVCRYVEANVLGPPSTDEAGRFEWPEAVPSTQAARLQNLFYAQGNLKYALSDLVGACTAYEKALEVVFGGLKLSEVVLGVVVTSMTGHAQVSSLHQLAAKVASKDYLTLWHEIKGNAGPLIKALGQEGLPVLLLLPDQVIRLSSVLFQSTRGVLPSLAFLATSTHHARLAKDAIGQANQTSSTILLTLAKLYQDALASPLANSLSSSLLLQGIPPSTSMLLPLYYLSLALHPSPSTCNNLGILLSTVTHSTEITLASGKRRVFNGQALALQYYTYGLQLDSKHPHLYTNLGSLLKDLGHLNEAIKMYEKALESNPKFDVALANLGNAIKDQGKVQDSVRWYKKAVSLNPNFAEAVCGLFNALNGVCDWRDRGGAGTLELVVNASGQLVSCRTLESTNQTKPRFGWAGKVLDIVDRQLLWGSHYGAGLLKTNEASANWLNIIAACLEGTEFWSQEAQLIWTKKLQAWLPAARGMRTEARNEGGFIIRMIERLVRRLQRKWYVADHGIVKRAIDNPGHKADCAKAAARYLRPTVPGSLPLPPIPTVLPFHTFTSPLTARQIRLISHRNALRISHLTMIQSWIPPHVYPPPRPPGLDAKLNIGYVSSDFNNHPLSHLMQSVFGFHDLSKCNVYLYATTSGDGSQYRQKIEREAQHFVDVSTYQVQAIVARIVEDNIHVLVNLNGYTKGAKNEIFAARPSPVQMSFMGFAGTLGAGWCDYVIADPVVCPPSMVSPEIYRSRRSINATDDSGSLAAQHPAQSSKDPDFAEFEGDLDPEEADETWLYTEKFLYMPHSYFVNDHRQGFSAEVAEAVHWPNITVANHLVSRKNSQASEISARVAGLEGSADIDWLEEENRRWKMRHELFPSLPEDYIIFANFNQLYKIDPIIFKIWLRILERIPKSILWLLRFPVAGEDHLRKTAEAWSTAEVASRIVFTDVAPKRVHINRGRVADLFLDTPECNAHTTAVDILWTGTPILTYPKYLHKMCSRVAASIAKATGFGDEMIVRSEEEYEQKAVDWSLSHSHVWVSDADLPWPTNRPSVDSASKSCQSMHRRSQGPLADLRRRLYLSRGQSRLFDTKRWVRNLEKGYLEAWERWVDGREFEELAESVESMIESPGSIWIADDDDGPATLEYTM